MGSGVALSRHTDRHLRVAGHADGYVLAISPDALTNRALGMRHTQTTIASQADVTASRRLACFSASRTRSGGAADVGTNLGLSMPPQKYGLGQPLWERQAC
jgi:hypothetical protein